MIFPMHKGWVWFGSDETRQYIPDGFGLSEDPQLHHFLVLLKENINNTVGFMKIQQNINITGVLSFLRFL